jgi:hypothetical protein
MFTRIFKPADPTPCIARPASSRLIESATAQIKLPTKNTTNPASNKGLRPQMSDILPHVGIVAVLASVYVLPIHVYPEADWKWLAIAGEAVEMMVMSSAETKTLALSDSMMIAMREVLSVDAVGSCPGCDDEDAADCRETALFSQFCCDWSCSMIVAILWTSTFVSLL